jgi:hypothetical protein
MEMFDSDSTCHCEAKSASMMGGWGLPFMNILVADSVGPQSFVSYVKSFISAEM